MENIINKIKVGSTTYSIEETDLTDVKNTLNQCLTDVQLSSSYAQETKQLSIDLTKTKVGE